MHIVLLRLKIEGSAACSRFLKNSVGHTVGHRHFPVPACWHTPDPQKKDHVHDISEYSVGRNVFDHTVVSRYSLTSRRDHFSSLNRLVLQPTFRCCRPFWYSAILKWFRWTGSILKVRLTSYVNTGWARRPCTAISLKPCIFLWRRTICTRIWHSVSERGWRMPRLQEERRRWDWLRPEGCPR